MTSELVLRIGVLGLLSLAVAALLAGAAYPGRHNKKPLDGSDCAEITDECVAAALRRSAGVGEIVNHSILRYEADQCERQRAVDERPPGRGASRSGRSSANTTRR